MKSSAIALIAAALGFAPHAVADTVSALMLSSTPPPSIGCAAPNPQQSTFSTGGGNIYEYIYITNMRVGDSVSVRWINPNYQTFMTTTWTHPVASPGNYCFTGGYMTSAEYWYQPGTWYLQVDVNGQYYQVAFTVIAQQQWNQAIITTGLKGYTHNLGIYDQVLYYSGQDCKIWAQNIVSTASNYKVALPITLESNYQWSTGINVVQMTFNQATLQPGWILQLKIASTGGPHTAIVLSTSNAGSNQGIWLLDSNWVNGGAGHYWVGIHFMTWQKFYSTFAQYSVYEITL